MEGAGPPTATAEEVYGKLPPDYGDGSGTTADDAGSMARRDPRGGVAHRLVHLDLKGAPPRMDFLLSLLPWLRDHGATGLLLEWEDMLPFSGQLACISAADAYSRAEVIALVREATRLGLEVIPLVQTMGHMEFVLKHPQFESLREEPGNYMDLCPLAAGAADLVVELVRQVVALHSEEGCAPLRYVHLGADEVFGFGSCAQCVNAIAREGGERLFTNHVLSSGVAVCTEAGITPLIWHDMLANYSAEQLEPFRRAGVEVVVWSYLPHVDDALPSGLWSRLRDSGLRVWGASAFKGASVPRAVWVPTWRHIANHASWMVEVASMVPLQGMFLTGWSRFNHTAALCETLPAGLPCLALCLDVVAAGGIDAESQTELMRQMGVKERTLEPSVASLAEITSSTHLLRFPGASAFGALARLELARMLLSRISENVSLMCPPHTSRKNVPLWRQLAGAASDVALRGEALRPDLRAALSEILLPSGVEEVLDCKLGVLCEEARRLLCDLEKLLTCASSQVRSPLSATGNAEAHGGAGVAPAADAAARPESANWPVASLAGNVALTTGIASVSPVNETAAATDSDMDEAGDTCGESLSGPAPDADMSAGATLGPASRGSPEAISSVATSSTVVFDSVAGAGSSKVVGDAPWFAPIDVETSTDAAEYGPSVSSCTSTSATATMTMPSGSTQRAVATALLEA